MVRGVISGFSDICQQRREWFKIVMFEQQASYGPVGMIKATSFQESNAVNKRKVKAVPGILHFRFKLF